MKEETSKQIVKFIQINMRISLAQIFLQSSLVE